MTVLNIVREAESLTVSEREEVIVSLLRGLAPLTPEVGDEEVESRRRELESGEIADISYDDLVAGLDLRR